MLAVWFIKRVYQYVAIYNSHDVNCLKSNYSNGHGTKEEAMDISYISKFVKKA